MRRLFFRSMILCFCLSFMLNSSVADATWANDRTTKYRVYQDNQILMEFANEQAAITYAQSFKNTHVESISDRHWIWDNYPRYKVYQYDISLPEWEFATLAEAENEAKKWAYSSVRDLQSTGWVWNNYPSYRLYHGENNKNSKEFISLDSAIQEAKQYTDAHIIDLHTSAWVWDNISEQNKKELRAQPPVYRVYQGQFSAENWIFSYLEDAVHEALKWSNSIIVNAETGQTIYSNLKRFKVYEQERLIDEFVSIDAAIALADQATDRFIQLNGRKIWSNERYYQVYQGEKKIDSYNTIHDAFWYAYYFNNASIRTLDGKIIWDNYRKLQFWGWNGVTQHDRIKEQVSGTVGLDVTSPPWFVLADAKGNVTDTSDVELARWLITQGVRVHPLVHNQFDPALTTAFLADKNAQTKFITTIVDQAAAIGVDGLNIDFESLNGNDRQAYTEFIASLTDYAHSKHLVISIDLPRGSVRWNHLSAFDHEKLAGIVDYIITMAYDQHYKGSPNAGSVSGLAWAEEGITEFLSYGIPRDKLILGIPFYVREWRIDKAGNLVDNRAIYLKDIPALIESKATTSTWDEEFEQYRIEYEEAGLRHVFWLEDENTVLARIELAQQYDLAGVAAWRLGYDTKELWELMLQKK